jgi:hypothetical protein
VSFDFKEGIWRLGTYEKTVADILCGTKDNGIEFSDLQSVLSRLGFVCRIKGDHFIYSREGIVEIINIQPTGNKAKPYQVKQTRNLILRYGMVNNNE